MTACINPVAAVSDATNSARDMMDAFIRVFDLRLISNVQSYEITYPRLS